MPASSMSSATITRITSGSQTIYRPFTSGAERRTERAPKSSAYGLRASRSSWSSPEQERTPYASAHGRIGCPRRRRDRAGSGATVLAATGRRDPVHVPSVELRRRSGGRPCRRRAAGGPRPTRGSRTRSSDGGHRVVAGRGARASVLEEDLGYAPGLLQGREVARVGE